MAILVHENQYCDLRYTIIPNMGEGARKLVEIIPREGVWLFEIKATYAKQHPASSYYVLGMNEKDVRRRFKRLFSWIGIIESVREVEGNEKRSILKDMKKFIV